MSTDAHNAGEIVHPQPPRIEPERWGRDHYSLLGYVFLRAHDTGTLDPERMRCKRGNPHMTATQQSLLKRHGGPMSTRLVGDADVAEVQEEHDDWDVLDDLIAAGLVVNAGTGANPRVVLTLLGVDVGSFICRHRQELGGWNALRWAPVREGVRVERALATENGAR